MEETTQHFSPFLLGRSPVPAVDPAELRRVWELQEKLEASHPGELSGMDIRGASNPGDFQAVWFRSSMLWLHRQMQPFPLGTQLPDALFSALATIPMTGMAPGVSQQELPFDIDELRRLVQEGLKEDTNC